MHTVCSIPNHMELPIRKLELAQSNKAPMLSAHSLALSPKPKEYYPAVCSLSIQLLELQIMGSLLVRHKWRTYLQRRSFSVTSPFSIRLRAFFEMCGAGSCSLAWTSTRVRRQEVSARQWITNPSDNEGLQTPSSSETNYSVLDPEPLRWDQNDLWGSHMAVFAEKRWSLSCMSQRRRDLCVHTTSACVSPGKYIRFQIGCFFGFIYQNIRATFPKRYRTCTESAPIRYAIEMADCPKWNTFSSLRTWLEAIILSTSEPK